MDSTNTLPQIEVAQSQKEATANELFAAASPSMFAAYNPDESDGLVWAYLGGRYASSLVANGSTTLGASTTTYMVADLATGAISFSTATTNWDDSANYGRCYRIVTGASSVTSWEDHRGPGPLGIFRTADPALLGAGVELRGLRFTADAASTTDADPGAGNLRWNNADQSLATMLYIDNATSDGASIGGFWGSLPSAGYIYLQQADNGNRWQLWEWTAAPTDGTGYYKFTVTLRGESADAIADDAGIYTIVSAKSGDPVQCIAIAVGDESTALTVGAAKVTFHMPFAFNLTGISAGVTVVPTGADIIADVNDGGTSIMTTNKLRIDAGEESTHTAATPPALTDTALAAGAKITVDVDQIGSTIAGAGLKVYLLGRPA
jgi:hypothetical protein